MLKPYLSRLCVPAYQSRLVSRSRLRWGVPLHLILSCQSVNECLLVWEVAGVFPVLVGEAAEPAFRVQNY